MGQQQSSPEPWRGPVEYQPDFLTAHVRSVSKQLAPKANASQTTLFAPAAVGSDSVMVAQAKRAQAAVSGVDHKPKPAVANYGADTFMAAHLQQMQAAAMRAMTATEAQQQQINRPSVGADSWLMKKQVAAAKQASHGVRNRFGLLPEKGTPEKIHQTVDGYETSFAREAKGLCPGAVQSNGRTFGPEQGKETMVKLDSYYVQFGKETHTYLTPKAAPKSVAEWQGIRPQIPVRSNALLPLPSAHGAGP